MTITRRRSQYEMIMLSCLGSKPNMGVAAQGNTLRVAGRCSRIVRISKNKYQVHTVVYSTGQHDSKRGRGKVPLACTAPRFASDLIR